MLCKVLRAISGCDATPGSVIDTQAWRPANVKGLINTRYLQPISLDQADGVQVTLARQPRPRKPTGGQEG